MVSQTATWLDKCTNRSTKKQTVLAENASTGLDSLDKVHSVATGDRKQREGMRGRQPISYMVTATWLDTRTNRSMKKQCLLKIQTQVWTLDEL